MRTCCDQMRQLVCLILFVQFLDLNQKMSGLECLINGKAEVPSDGCHVRCRASSSSTAYYPFSNPMRVLSRRDDAQLGIVILVLYVLCNVCINILLMQVIKMTSISVMYGTTLIGFFLSFGVLAWYQMDPDGFGAMNFHDGIRDWIPDSIYVDVVAFLILFAGKILYQWDEDPDVEATTRSAEDKEAASLLTDDDYGLRYM